MKGDWNTAKAAAMKVLGDKAEVPDLPSTITKAEEAFEKSSAAFDKSRADCESALLDVQNALSAVKNAGKQFTASIEKSDFELDSKTDAKKIQQGQKILLTSLQGSSKNIDDNDKILDELDKHLVQMGKYKLAK